jgi:predicted ArsR family transcriptional regulator
VGIGRSIAAYHLDRMVEDRLLEVSYARRSGRTGPGAGRPAKLYSRSCRQFHVSLPARDYELAAQLLAEAVEADPSGAARSALEEAARRLGNEFAADIERRRPDQSADDALPLLEEVLAERGYEPFHDEDGTVRLRNCPFDRLADDHRQLVCGMNLAVLDEVAKRRLAGRPASPRRARPRPPLPAALVGPTGRSRGGGRAPEMA